jgi:hypothetical protein
MLGPGEIPQLCPANAYLDVDCDDDQDLVDFARFQNEFSITS